MSEEQQLTDRVSQFQEEVQELGKRFNSTEADRVIAAEMAATRQQHTKNGFLMASNDTLSKYEIDQRVAYDRALSSDGTQVEIKRDVLQSELAAAIEAAQPLRSFALQYGRGTEKWLVAELLDEFKAQGVRADLRGLTRSQMLERYSRLTDDEDNTAVRLIEDAVLRNDLSRLGIVDDANAEADVIVIPKLKAAIEERRKARVPEYLHKLQADVANAFDWHLGLNLRYLRKGIGVAARTGVSVQ
jgi:hypothetical protein